MDNLNFSANFKHSHDSAAILVDLQSPALKPSGAWIQLALDETKSAVHISIRALGSSMINSLSNPPFSAPSSARTLLRPATTQMA